MVRHTRLLGQFSPACCLHSALVVRCCFFSDARYTSHTATPRSFAMEETPLFLQGQKPPRLTQGPSTLSLACRCPCLGTCGPVLFSMKRHLHVARAKAPTTNTRALLHKGLAPQGPCYTRALPHKGLAAQGPCLTRALLHKGLAPQGPCPTKGLATQALLHKGLATQGPCYTRALLHKGLHKGLAPQGL
jgi:hypothetical protein